MRRRLLIMALVAAVVVPAQAVSPIRPAEFRTGAVIMGTVLEVTVCASDAQEAQRLAGASIAEARRWDDILTTWRSEGELARLNARSGTGPVAVSPDLARALVRMRVLAAGTRGAFDPAVGNPVAFFRSTSLSPAARPDVGRPRFADAVTVRLGTVTLSRGVALDAGGIGKGIALDAMAELLRRERAQAAFMDFGGSSQLAMGAPPDEPEGWEVLLAGLHPDTAHGVIRLRDAALSTSRTPAAGAEEGAIIDPANGRPVSISRLATVRAMDATSADAWSTALIVLGHPGLAQLESAGLEAFVEDGSGVVATTRFPAPLPRAERSGDSPA